MARPHDIWEFGWSGGYHNRHDYIQTLPETEQEWATALFHYIDECFRLRIEHDLSRRTDTNVDSVRDEARIRVEPPNDDRWRERFLPGGHGLWYEREEDSSQ